MKYNLITHEHSTTINNKEMQILITVINKYNFKLVSAEKSTNVYKIMTDSGKFCLRRRRHWKNQIKNGSILTEELLLNKFTNTAKYLMSENGTYSVSYKKDKFYLTEWVEGYECDLTNIDEAVNSVELLGRFHTISNMSDNRKMDIVKTSKNWPKIFASNLHNFEKLKKIINSKRIKNEFDVLFLENMDNFYNRGMYAINILNKSKYYKLLKYANDNKIICLNNFYYHNIIKKDGKYFIIDLDQITVDIQINDLGTLIRRLMFKKAYGWNFYFAKTLIEAYNSTNKLSKEELEIMLALIIYPIKFWKLGNKRYIKQKKWSETKYLQKLSKITSYNESQQKFFDDYWDYLQEYI